MLDTPRFAVFLTAAIILAITPGPGIFYVLTRSIKGGRSEGIASTCGTAIGGMFHVVAAALGLSVFLATSALAFGLVKYAGAIYLVYLGLRTLLSSVADEAEVEPPSISKHAAFKQGIVTEGLNPKTALFFLAFIPQFINPDGFVVLQFLLLGTISVGLNSSVDLIVAFLAGPLGKHLKENARLRRRQRLFSGVSFMALGAYVALADSE